MPLTKSEEKRKKAAQLKKKKKRKKTKKAENEDKPEQQGQTSVDDGIVGDNQGTHLFMFVDLTSTIPHVHFEDIIFFTTIIHEQCTSTCKYTVPEFSA